MPNCFQLCRDGQAVALQQIDEEMCNHFNAPCDPVRWFRGWYDFIGFDLATGRDFAQIRAIYEADPDLSDF
jgi:hypothetical protein